MIHEVNFSSGINLSFANAIRRTILEHVHTHAIEKIRIHTNTSGMYDKVLEKRFELIPVKNGFDEDVESWRGELDVSNDSVEGILEVTTDDVQGTIEFPHTFPLVNLFPGQRLHVEIETRKGTGYEHAKFCPVSVCMVKEPSKIVMELTGTLPADVVVSRALVSMKKALKSLHIKE